jgi:MFS transporter, YNFM family, putative membrane transport protein
MFTEKRAIAVALAAIGAFIDLYLTQPLLPMLALEFAATPTEVSRTISATTFAVALIAPFTGAVADVLGRKRIIVAAMFALVVPTLMIAFAHSLGGVIFWRFMQGLLLPPIFAVTVAYIGEEWPPAQATSVTGLYMAASGVGGFLGRFLTGLLASYFGWRASFIGVAGVTLACAVATALLMPRERHFVRSGGIPTQIAHMAAHLRNMRLLATYSVGFGVLFSFVGIFTYINFLLAAPPFNLSTAALGAIFITYLIGSAIATMTGALVEYLGRRWLVVTAVGFWLIGLALTLTGSLWVILLGLAVCVTCGFLCQSSATSYVAISARQGRSSAVGLYVSFYYVGGGLGAVIPGIGWSLAGWPGCVATVAVVIAAIAAIALIFWREPAA